MLFRVKRGTQIIAKCLLISCQVPSTATLSRSNDSMSVAIHESRHMTFYSCPVLSAPQIPEVTGHSSPANIPDTPRGLHTESGETLPLSPWKGPFIEPSLPHPSVCVSSVAFCSASAMGCGLVGPHNGHPGLFTNTSAHCVPSRSLTVESDPEMSAPFLGHRGGDCYLKPGLGLSALCFGLYLSFTTGGYYGIWTAVVFLKLITWVLSVRPQMYEHSTSFEL